MIKTIKHIICLCAVTSLLALSFIGCTVNINTPETPEVKYKVTFDENGHGTKPNAIEVTENTILSKEQLKPLSTNEKFNFVGWFDGETEAKSGEYKVTKNVTLIAKWTEWDTVADVVFSIKSGEQVDINDELIITCPTKDATIHCTVVSGENKTELSSKNRLTYKITEPFTISAYATKKGMIKSNSITPNYIIKTYTVSFNANGHGTAPTAKTDLKNGDKITKPEDLSADGVFFVGWFNGNNKIISDIVIEESDITLTARWCKIGDIILNNGNYVSSATIKEEQKAKAVAVVCGKNSQGKILGLGLKQSEEKLIWATKDTIGHNTNFTKLICDTQSYGTGAADRAKFDGDFDGSDNWNVIVKEYINQNKTEKDALADCSAFAWVNNYGSTYSLPKVYQDGWYMPSIAELTEIYKNRKEINNAIQQLGTQSVSLLKIDTYLSSSQSSPETFVSVLDFIDGDLPSGKKTYAAYVCCIRAF